MTTVTLHIPWLLIAAVAALALYGLFHLARQGLRLYRIVRQLRLKRREQESQSAFIQNPLTLADQRAKDAVKAKVRSVWVSFSSDQWLDLQTVRDECVELAQEIAKAYYPDAKQPEYEVTIIELLRLNERITRNVIELLTPFKTLHQISVSSIMNAKTLLEQTHSIVGQKGIKTGRKIATRVWQALNILNPQYLVFKGVSEVAMRQAMASLFRIVGNEAAGVYRSSHASRLSTDEWVEKFEFELPEEVVEEVKKETGETEPDADEEETVYAEAEIVDEENEKPNLKARMSKKIAEIFTQFVEGSMHLWDKMVNPEKIIAKYQKDGLDVQRIGDIRSVPVERANALAEHYIHKGKWLSTAEGAATGLGGVLMISADAVSFIALQLRTIQQIGYCYGFDMRLPEEKMFAIKLLAEAYQHPTKQERQSLMQEMRFASNILRGKTPLFQIQQKLFAQGLAKAAEKIGIQLGSRKAAQVLPFVGAAVGGYLNRKVMKDIATIAQEVYRERFLENRKCSQTVQEGESGKP